MRECRPFVWICPCRVAHDCTMPAALQSTSLRLLYNLIETIFQRRADAHTSEMYRGLLSSVLECFVRKLGALRSQVGRIVRCEASVHQASCLPLAAWLTIAAPVFAGRLMPKARQQSQARVLPSTRQRTHSCTGLTLHLMAK